jgi:hypothetical protein
MQGVWTAALLLSACATVSPPEYPREHPANPEATQAPVGNAAGALDSYRPAIARKTPAAAQPTTEDSHGQH